jgi:Tfp pilus assembly protein PilV
MLNGFKLGIRNGKQNMAPILALLLLTIAAISPAKLHAADRHSASARLQIQVTVMPTLVAMQQAQRMQAQPSQSPVTFSLTPSAKQTERATTQSVTIPDKNGSTQTAVLQTSTFVAE